MRYSAIYRAKTDFPVARLCEFWGVSESGYYAWQTARPANGLSRTRLCLVEEIQRI